MKLLLFLAKAVAAIKSNAAVLHYNNFSPEQYNLTNLNHPTPLVCSF
jgi:hypothetical protein